MMVSRSPPNCTCSAKTLPCTIRPGHSPFPTVCYLSRDLAVVVALYKHVLPKLGHRFVRQFMSGNAVQTIVLLVPEALVTDDTDDDFSSSDEDGERGGGAADKDSSGANASSAVEHSTHNGGCGGCGHDCGDHSTAHPGARHSTVTQSH